MSDDLLRAYDEQLREGAEMQGALSVQRLGPLWLAILPGERGFIGYRALPNDAGEIAELVQAALAHFRDYTAVTEAEWKTRAHDVAPGLYDALAAAGFVAEERESVMIGRAEGLLAEGALPAGVVVRRAATSEEVWAANQMQGVVFADPHWRTRAEEAVRGFESGSAGPVWIAVADEQIVCSGRLEPVEGTEFAGIWGGATLPAWRQQGIYRVLTARRAQDALASGKTFIHSDSTDYSRPILERSGFVAVTSTTPYLWHRADG